MNGGEPPSEPAEAVSDDEVDLFALAARVRAAEIERIKADRSAKPIVWVSLRNFPKLRIRWPDKF